MTINRMSNSPEPSLLRIADDIERVRDSVEPVTSIADMLKQLIIDVEAQAMFDRVLWADELREAESVLADSKRGSDYHVATQATINALRFRIAVWDRLYPHLVEHAVAIHAELVAQS